MEQSNTTTETSEPRSTPVELVRPREGRMIAGVAQGLANRLDLPVVLIRVIFALLIFGGGLGLALYAAGWFLIRSEDETETPAARLFSGASSTRSWIGIGLVFIAALILLENFTFLSGGVVWAIGLLVVGVLLYTGDLPRLVKEPTDDKEGVQQMTTPIETTAPVTWSDPPSGDAPAGGGIPPTPTPAAPAPPPVPPNVRETSYLGRITVGVMLIGVGALAILDNITLLAIEAEPRHYLALAVTILGLGLMVGGFVGRARWLILLGVIVLPTLLFSPVFENDWDGSRFDLRVAPSSFEELETEYRVNVGSLVLDLRQLPWDNDSVFVDLEVDAGNIELFLPEDVGLRGRADADIGRVHTPDGISAGFDDNALFFDETEYSNLLELEADVNIGNITIHREDIQP